MALQNKFKIGDRVVLSEVGRSEIPSLRKKTGIVIDVVSLNCVHVSWGKDRKMWMNHESNLELKPGWNKKVTT